MSTHLCACYSLDISPVLRALNQTDEIDHQMIAFVDIANLHIQIERTLL